jgi:hypothetical protein
MSRWVVKVLIHAKADDEVTDPAGWTVKTGTPGARNLRSYETFRARRQEPSASDAGPRSLRRGAMVNALSPHP